MTWQQTQDYVAKSLYDKGFWVYQTINKHSGQPVDIIACKNNITYVFEVKHCSNDYFQFNRIEDNQKLSLERYKYCGNEYSYFAIYYEKYDCLVFIKSDIILEMSKTEKSLKYEKALTLAEKEL